MNSVGFTLQKFGFKRARKGAIIIGLLAAFMIVMQGVGYYETYPNKAAQAQFAASLKSAPSLGLLYGDSEELDHGVNGYVAYRVSSFMSLIVAIWALMAMTKLLRGNEEDGRWEVLRTGATTARRATFHVVTGFLYALVFSFAVSTLLTIAGGSLPSMNMPVDMAILINLTIFAPALLFVGVGVLVSQLALSRRRALLYGLTPLLVTYLIRGIGNTDADREWLLGWTPFGWNQLINPVISPQPWWLALFAIFTVIFLTAGIMLAKRDLGESIIKESIKVKSRFFLLGGPGRQAVRQNAWIFIAWALGALGMTAIIANIVTIAAEATAESPTLSQSVLALAGNTDDLKIAFLGAGLVFIVMVLMIMATTIIGSIRGDEAKQYLDNILVQPHRRTTWLLTRLIIGVIVTLAISVACGLTIIATGSSQDINLEFWKVMALAVAMTGTIVFLIGLGTLVYGFIPRFAVILMYLVITWSFLVDLISSAVKLDEWLLQSSLFHYLSFNLAEWPDWKTFAWLCGLGIVMAIIGIFGFARRDIITE